MKIALARIARVSWWQRVAAWWRARVIAPRMIAMAVSRGPAPVEHLASCKRIRASTGAIGYLCICDRGER